MAAGTVLVFLTSTIASFALAIWLVRPILRGVRIREDALSSILALISYISPGFEQEAIRTTARSADLTQRSMNSSREDGDISGCVVDPDEFTQELDALILASATEFSDLLDEHLQAWPAKKPLWN